MFYYNLFVCSLSILFWIYLIYAANEIYHHRAPFVPAVGKHKKIAIKIISDLLQQSSHPLTVIDAGSGNGSLLFDLAQMHSQHKFIGIEYNKLLYNSCQKKKNKLKQTNIEFFNQDLTTYDYNSCDIVYYFGIPSLTSALEQQLLNTDKKLDIVAIECEFAHLTLVSKTPFKIFNNSCNVYHYKN